jgi:lysophospholipase L1-like esterase
LYDATGKRLQVKTGDNVALSFSRVLPAASATGVLQLDFLPTTKYPNGGEFVLRLEQDANNYYQVQNTDGYGAGAVIKVVGGQVAEEVAFRTEYRQGTSYRVEVIHSEGTVRVDAFGAVVVLDQDSAPIPVSRFVVEMTQQDAYVDNIYFTSGPFLKILAPIDYHIQQANSLKSTVITSDINTASGVKFTLRSGNNLTIIAVHTDMVKPFEHIFSNLQKGEYQVDVILVDSNGNEIQGQLTSDIAVSVGLGDYYVAVGDSITYGEGDDISTDDISHDLRNNGGGYSPILNNQLTSVRGYPHTVVNEGLPGETSAGGLTRIQSVIDSHSESKYFLILYGTNDSHGTLLTPSGLDANGNLLAPSDPSYAGTFLDNMQQIINRVKSAQKIPVLAKVPITLGPCSSCTPFTDPDTAARNLLIQKYNIVINALIANNNILISAPDFYGYFRLHQGEFSDNLHPNGLGYQSMSNLWFNSLTK